MTRPILGSLTRIADLDAQAFELQPTARSAWRTGDYVGGEVIDTRGRLHGIELSNGRLVEVMEGDVVIGALGYRAATLEAVGSWEAIEGDVFEALTPAGLFGRITSKSPFLRPLMRLRYAGHALRSGRKLTMQGSLAPAGAAPTGAAPTGAAPTGAAPIVLVVGTSMSAGKTLSGRVIVHLLTQLGLRVVGAKLTGAARYRDVLSFGDAGAVAVYDFVDAGLPSTVCSEEDYQVALHYLMARIAAEEPDVIVAEAGASPLEPYNGKTAMTQLGARVRFQLLCAQDPYAVLGVQAAFARRPDLVAGGAANTCAGIDLVRQLTGLPALNLCDRRSWPQLELLLRQALAL